MILCLLHENGYQHKNTFIVAPIARHTSKMCFQNYPDLQVAEITEEILNFHWFLSGMRDTSKT